MTKALKELQANNQKRIIAFAEWVIKWRWLALVGTLAVAMAFGSGGRFLGFNGDYHVFFSEDNPQLLAYEALQNKYTKDDNVFIVIEAEDGEIFDQESLQPLKSLQKTHGKHRIPRELMQSQIFSIQRQLPMIYM